MHLPELPGAQAWQAKVDWIHINISRCVHNVSPPIYFGNTLPRIRVHLSIIINDVRWYTFIDCDSNAA
jgi:hypothetical protein